MKTNLIDNPSVVDFVEAVQYDALNYLKDDPGAIVAVETGGLFYALRLYCRVREELRDVKFLSYKRDHNSLTYTECAGRKLLVVDDSISTGHSYRKIKKDIEDRWMELGYTDLKFAVNIDMRGIADISPKEDLKE